MPKCPKCGKEIDHLVYYAYELQRANLWVFEDGESEYSTWDSLGETKGDPDYECPECGEVLFHNEDEAINFLRGKKVAKE